MPDVQAYRGLTEAGKIQAADQKREEFTKEMYKLIDHRYTSCSDIATNMPGDSWQIENSEECRGRIGVNRGVRVICRKTCNYCLGVQRDPWQD